MTEPSAAPDNAQFPRQRGGDDSAGPPTPDPTNTDHPTGTEQAAENATTEPPS